MLGHRDLLRLEIDEWASSGSGLRPPLIMVLQNDGNWAQIPVIKIENDTSLRPQTVLRAK